MIRLNVVQGTPEWEMARLGIPTASSFKRILTAKTLKLSSSAGEYRNQLLAEWLTGMPLEFGGGPNTLMQRGTGMEAEARMFYELQYDVPEVEQVGFLLRDDRMAGCSPDGLVGEDGGLELKCPMMHTHIGYLLDPQSLADQYAPQVQGCLYITGRAWWDLVAYHPQLPPVYHRIARDEKYIAALDAALDTFVADLLAAREQLAPHRLAEAA